MSLITQYKSVEQEIADLQKRLADMKPSVDGLLDLEKNLKEMADVAGVSYKDAAILLHPKFADKQDAVSATAKTPRRPREIKVYDNPHTGELVETKGGNHKTLKAWKQQYGGDVVESWLRK